MSFETAGQLASILSTLAAVFGLFYIAKQLKEAQKTRNFQATLELVNFLGSEEQRSLRRRLYAIPEADIIHKADAFVDVLERVGFGFSRAGFLAEKGFIDQNLVLEMYSESIIATWNRLRPYVVRAREMRGKQYLSPFERLATAAEQHWLKANPGQPLPRGLSVPGPNEPPRLGGGDAIG
jgi:hypothetical protein